LFRLNSSTNITAEYIFNRTFVTRKQAKEDIFMASKEVSVMAGVRTKLLKGVDMEQKE
jgi:hypothetical protein